MYILVYTWIKWYRNLMTIRSSRHPPIRDILDGFEGVVRPGEMLRESISFSFFFFSARGAHILGKIHWNHDSITTQWFLGAPTPDAAPSWRHSPTDGTSTIPSLDLCLGSACACWRIANMASSIKWPDCEAPEDLENVLIPRTWYGVMKRKESPPPLEED